MKFEIEIPKQTQVALRKPCHLQTDRQTERQTRWIQYSPLQIRWVDSWHLPSHEMRYIIFVSPDTWKFAQLPETQLDKWPQLIKAIRPGPAGYTRIWWSGYANEKQSPKKKPNVKFHFQKSDDGGGNPTDDDQAENVCTYTWWRHQMETFSALLAFCAGNSPVTGEFPAQRPVTRSFDVTFDLRLNKPLSVQPCGWWFETPSCSLWRHCNESVPTGNE